MISAQKRMLTLFCITFVLATLMTISHYGGPTPRTGNGRRLVLNNVDQEKLVKILNSVPYQSSSLSDLINDNDENSNNQINFQPSPLPVNVLVQQQQQRQFSEKPSLSSSSSSSSLSSSFSSSKLIPSPSSHSPVIQSSKMVPSQSSTINLSSSPSPPLPPSLSSSPPSNRPLLQSSPLAPAFSVITTPKHSPSPMNSLSFHPVNESSQPTAINRNDTKNQTEEQKFRGFFTSDEIALTRQFLIDKPNFCDTDNGASLDLLILVNSAIGNFEARQAIRETWGKFAVERGSLLLFLIGDSRDSFINEQLEKENQQYSDLLQGAFIDSYYNLTLKTMSMMKWVSDNCDKVKFVLKVDDDMFINMQLLVDFCETRNFTKSIIGHIGKKWKPHRDVGSKWFVSQSVFNGTYFPNFATGPCYMFSGDVAKSLSEQSYKMKPLHLEDVFMTGIVAEAAKVRRLNYSLMKNVRVKVTPCNFKRFMTSHKHTPQEIISLWNQVYDEMDKPCEKSTSKPTGSSSTKPPKKTDSPSKKT